MSHPQISIAIPHFNRFQFVQECLAGVLNDSRVREIVINDDCSTDDSYQRLCQWAYDRPKVSLFRNRANVDCYRNKRHAVSLASTDWVILFDDDNILTGSYLDALWKLPQWDEDTVYCPEFAEPHFDYRAFSGMTAHRGNVAKLMKEKHFATALNTANYFFNRNTWMGVWDGTVNPHTADSIYQAYRLLQAGKKLMFVPGLRYFHRVHEGSHYKRNVHRTGNFANQVEAKLNGLR